MPNPNSTKVRFAEYAFVLKQAYQKALCPFCDEWHRSSDGKPINPENTCVGIYVRRRKAAFVVCAIPNDRAGKVGEKRAVPGGRNLDRACAAAEKAWYDQIA